MQNHFEAVKTAMQQASVVAAEHREPLLSVHFSTHSTKIQAACPPYNTAGGVTRSTPLRHFLHVTLPAFSNSLLRITP
jgi:hypothetical protein